MKISMGKGIDFDFFDVLSVTMKQAQKSGMKSEETTERLRIVIEN